ncbi:ABC transporter substrate-binding protein [Paenibacillus sp. SI8]|uniref:ABC transporter substrate-binding protein n=1 Tax=unclassified Paenibacillus TaxID=185978 RepID=UPI0034679FF0
MKTIKKNLFVLTTVLMSLALVATACSGGSKTTGSTTSPNESSKAVAPDGKTALKPYEVVMVYPDNPLKDNPKVQDAMNEYLKKTYPELNVSVKLNPIDFGAWSDKTNLMFASNEKFDLIFTANWLGPFDTQVNKGALLPLDDLLKKYGPDIEAVEKDYHVGAVRKGKLYAIHTHQELGNPQGIVVRKDLAEKYKFDLTKLTTSKNMADLEPLLKTIKENEPGITPMVGGTTGPGEFPLDGFFAGSKIDGLTGPTGLEISKNDMKIVNIYETESYMELAKLTHKWYKLGYINKDATSKGVRGDEKMRAKLGFAIAGGSSEILADTDTPQPMPSLSKSLGLELIQIPMAKDMLKTGKLMATMQGISKTSADPDRAMMLLNLFFKDAKLLTLFNFGIEGTHYVMKDGQIDLPAGMTSATSPYYHDIQWQIGNQLLNYTRVGEDPKKYEIYEKFNKEVAKRKSNMYGFIFDSEPVKNELIAIDNITKTYDPGLKSGTLDPEVEVPNLIKKLKEIGMDKVIAEAQKQLDEWAKTNGK